MSIHTEMIRMINERLAEPEKCIDNSSIAAVASIALYEVATRISYLPRVQCIL